MRRLYVSLFLLLILPVPAAQAFQLSEEQLAQFDSPASPYKVSPEMVPAVRALLSPYDMDAEFPGGWILDGITIERFYVRLTFLKGSASFHAVLLPSVVEVDEQSAATESFKIVTEGQADPAAMSALIAAIGKNDQAGFWPKAPALVTQEGRKVPPSVRKVHYSELLGDFFLLLLLAGVVLAAPAFRKVFAGRTIGWWWLLVGVGLLAVGLRVLFFVAWGEDQSHAVWTPSADLPHVSLAWFLNTISRFFVVTLNLVTMLNIAAGALTVVGIFLMCSLAFPGLLAPALAALFVATLPAHVALSASVTVMIPFSALLVWTFVTLSVYERTGSAPAHFLAALLGVFTLFARPEALVFVVPLMLFYAARVRPRDWLKPTFFAPFLFLAAALVIRCLTLSDAPSSGERILSWEVEVGGMFNNLGVWFFDLGRVPLVGMLLWAAGIAARPWRRDLAGSLVVGCWLLLGFAVYFHVDLTDTFQGGRAFLFFVPPLAWLAASGATMLNSLSRGKRVWATILVVIWLLATPFIHYSAVRQDYKALDYATNFLREV